MLGDGYGPYKDSTCYCKHCVEKFGKRLDNVILVKSMCMLEDLPMLIKLIGESYTREKTSTLIESVEC